MGKIVPTDFELVKKGRLNTKTCVSPKQCYMCDMFALALQVEYYILKVEV